MIVQNVKCKVQNDSLKLKIILLIMALTFNFALLTFNLSPVQAQTPPSDVAALFPLQDSEAEDGDILFYTDQGIIRANIAYSNKIFGVLQDQPLIVYRDIETNGKPVVRSGVTKVNVIDANGQIKAGDYITSSTTAGKGQKTAISGYALGVALADMNGPSDKIPVAIRIEYVELTNTRSVLRLFDYLNIAAFASSQDPEKASQFIKFSVAGLMVIGSLIFSFLVFARSITKSIEAIGRNPLAKNAIQLSIIINAGLAIATIVISLIIAYIIIRL